MTRPRVALLGNVANCLVPVTLALRQGGFDADLFVDDRAPEVARPEHLLEELADAPWIRRGRWFSGWTSLTPGWSPVVRELRAYDVIVVSGPGPIYAQFAGRPWCWWASGHDLTAAPFPWAFRSSYGTWRRRLAAFPLAGWQRRAAARASVLWVQPFAPFADAVRRLGLGRPPVSDDYLPLLVHELDGRAGPDDDESVRAVIARVAGADLVVFHPSRLMVRQSEAARRSGQWKGNDRLLLGVAELRRRRPDLDVSLILIDSPASPDRDLAHQLVATLGLGDAVVWARPAGTAFDRGQMRRLYAASDVVAADFGAGWFGNVALEGMGLGRPVLSHVDEAPMRALYPDGHPIVPAVEPGEIAARLEELLEPGLRQRLGMEGAAWVARHHSLAVAGPLYVEAVSAVLQAWQPRPESPES